MDLSFSSFDRADELVALPGDLAALMVGVAARQGASRTAIAQAMLAADAAACRADAERTGRASFNPAVATLLAAWSSSWFLAVNAPFTAPGQSIFNARCQNDDGDIKPGMEAPIEDL